MGAVYNILSILDHYHKTYLAAMLIGAIVVGIVLPLGSSYVDGRLYHDSDAPWGIGDDMFGALVPLFWYIYSAFYGAFVGALLIASSRNKQAWTGILWIGTAIVFFFLMPAERPQGELTSSGDTTFLPFKVFFIVPAWLCAGIFVTGLILFLRLPGGHKKNSG